MIKNRFNRELCKMISESTCSYTTVEYIEKMLIKLGFTKLYEKDKWNFKEGQYFITRNDASIIAFDIPKNNLDKFSIITTHCDTPSLLLKPSGEYVKDNYLMYNVMPYGGLLNYGWLDHPLSLSGRVVYKYGKDIKTKIVDVKDALAVVPSVAIHQNDSANSNLDLNMQTDLQPVLALSKNKNDWLKYLESITKIENIIDYDFFLYNNEEPKIFGINNDLLLAPRIDNITSVYSALSSFINSKSKNIKVFCSFNNEEIGSLTEEGADSNFLLDILKRISATIEMDVATSFSKSFIISSDNTHAIHPNHDEYADKTGKLKLGDGVAIVREVTSTTNAISSSIIKNICDINKIKYADATAKNDLTGGSTLSGISLRHLSVLSVDVGIAQLAMHSSVELCSLSDVYELYKLMNKFYESDINITKNTIKINRS